MSLYSLEEICEGCKLEIQWDRIIADIMETKKAHAIEAARVRELEAEQERRGKIFHETLEDKYKLMEKVKELEEANERLNEALFNPGMLRIP